MRLLLHKNNYYTAYLDEEKVQYEIYWHKQTRNLTDEGFKKVILEIVCLLEGRQYPMVRYLFDNRDFLFSISPDLQTWHANHVGSKVLKFSEAPLRNKTAIIASAGFISQLSIEQTMDENKKTSAYGATRYFDALEEAKDWLNK